MKKIDPLQSKALQFISLQHELGMAIGLDLHLSSMLRKFIKICIPRLGLLGMSCYMFEGRKEKASEAHLKEFKFSHLLSIPESIERKIDTAASVLPSHFLKQKYNISSSIHKNKRIFSYNFNLSHLGYISLHRINTPLEPDIIELLKPIFERLSISCQASLEHEQLLQAVSAKEKAEKIITHQLFHDELTGLANRRMLMKTLVKDINQSKNNHLLGAILYLDLDRFKSVNDTLGHSVGDQLLKAVAQKLASLVRSRDLVARLSGDEFAILLSNIRDTHNDTGKNIEPILTKIRDTFSQPLTAGEHTLHITPSIGIETYSTENTDAYTVLRNADTAMYIAKSQGSNISRFYDKAMSLELEQRLEIEKQLQLAVNSLDQFELFYQPQYCIDGECVGAEALIRWSHPNTNITAPATFIPIAEDTGLMLKLGRWILMEACLNLKELEDNGIPKNFTKLSVNVSAVQFNQAHFVQDLLEMVKQTGISPSLLTIELTESTLIESVADTVDKMIKLKNHGIGISIDDFGTGYSSLAYLNSYPIATLKIDQVFVKNLQNDAGNRAIVNAMLGLGKSLDVEVIAEGVETSDELACLKKMNCNHYQGYYFGHPRPFKELAKKIACPV